MGTTAPDGVIREVPYALIKNVNFDLQPVSITVTDRNGSLREWPIRLDRLEAGIPIYAGDQIRLAYRAPLSAANVTLCELWRVNPTTGAETLDSTVTSAQLLQADCRIGVDSFNPSTGAITKTVVPASGPTVYGPFTFTADPSITVEGGPTYTTISGLVYFNQCPNFTELSLPNTTINDGAFLRIQANENPLLTIDISSLTELDGLDIQGSGAEGGVLALDVTNLANVGANGLFIGYFPGNTSLSLPALTHVTGNIVITDFAGITSLSLPSLVSAGDELRLENYDALTSLELPLLATAGDDLTFGLAQCTTFSLPSLVSVGGSGFITIGYSDTVTSIALPVLVTTSGISITQCPALQTLTISAALQTSYLDVDSAALTEAGVDAVLVALDESGVEGGTVNLSGGTSSPPGAAGLTAKTNLEGKGWTVAVN